MAYRGHVKNGTIVFRQPINLPDGTPISVETLDIHPIVLHSPLIQGISMAFYIAVWTLIILGVISGAIMSIPGIASPPLLIIFLIIALASSLFVGAIAGLGAAKLTIERTRVAAGQCIRCGYDIRATPDRCPECGHIARRRINS